MYSFYLSFNLEDCRARRLISFVDFGIVRVVSSTNTRSVVRNGRGYEGDFHSTTSSRVNFFLSEKN